MRITGIKIVVKASPGEINDANEVERQLADQFGPHIRELTGHFTHLTPTTAIVSYTWYEQGRYASQIKRVEVALALAEKHLDANQINHAIGPCCAWPCLWSISNVEVEMARQLFMTELYIQDECGEQPMPPSLLAFVEKIEAVRP